LTGGCKLRTVVFSIAFDVVLQEYRNVSDIGIKGILARSATSSWLYLDVLGFLDRDVFEDVFGGVFKDVFGGVFGDRVFGVGQVGLYRRASEFGRSASYIDSVYFSLDIE